MLSLSIVSGRSEPMETICAIGDNFLFEEAESEGPFDIICSGQI